MNNPSPSDRSLDEALNQWQVTPLCDPQFRPSVWARIEAARRNVSWMAFARAHAAAVTVFLALALVAGGWIGRQQAQARVETDRAALANSYVRGLDARTMTMP